MSDRANTFNHFRADPALLPPSLPGISKQVYSTDFPLVLIKLAFAKKRQKFGCPERKTGKSKAVFIKYLFIFWCQLYILMVNRDTKIILPYANSVCYTRLQKGELAQYFFKPDSFVGNFC